MRIDANNPAILLPTDRSNSSASKAAPSELAASTEDRTTFSSTGTAIQSLTAEAMSTPPVRQDKVDALRQSVASGGYHLDPTSIASAIAESGD
jgi:flagellar biosynthesis anti-sigma factor FlgM